MGKDMAAEIRKQGTARTKDLIQPNGEVVPSTSDTFSRDMLTTPDLPAVEATLDRNRLLLQDGFDMAAMAVDAALSIQASNSLKKCWRTNLLRRISRSWNSCGGCLASPMLTHKSNE